MNKFIFNPGAQTPFQGQMGGQNMVPAAPEQNVAPGAIFSSDPNQPIPTVPMAPLSPSGLTSAPNQGMVNTAPITATTQPPAETLQSLEYMNGYLKSQIGRRVKVDFLIGTGTFLDKTGVLVGVGANYILINETETDDVVLCDFYAIKFVTFYY